MATGVQNIFSGERYGRMVEEDGHMKNENVRAGVELLFIKNEKSRGTAACKAGCEWRLHASLVMGGPTFQVKTLTGKHSCVRATTNKFATYKYLAKRIEMIVIENPSILVEKLRRTIIRKCRVEVNKYKVYRAKKAALEKLKGLDGCFLKTTYGGQLLVAVGRDGNENIFPISMAVVQVENYDNWRWFINELLEDIGEGRWTFITDRQKRLLEALSELAPDCEHRFCLRHLYQNFSKKHPGVDLKGLLWGAANTTNKNDFTIWMKRIETADPKTSPDYETAAEWLSKIPPAHWARSHFPISSFCDFIVNNMTESFNSYILEARDMPIISMLEWIRTKLMIRIQVKKKGIEKYVGEVCPNIVKKSE
ncbi:uncharacterized protein [Henckelia pumila]|uniref:uncharacterized protein n=1 Tax=Henckelia pumila TaxID=405737 RepID=UPI003C6E69BB